MIRQPQIISGSLCYLFYEQQVLLLQRANPPHQGLWSPPGGKMEFGESPQACCIREIYEETSIHIVSPTLRAIQTVVDVAIPIHWQLFIFRVDLTEKIAPLAQSEHDEGDMRWFAFDELETITRPYTDQQHWSSITGEQSTLWHGKFVYDTPDTLVEEIVYEC